MTELTQRRIGVIYVASDLKHADDCALTEKRERGKGAAADQMSWHCSFAPTGPIRAAPPTRDRDGSGRARGAARHGANERPADANRAKPGNSTRRLAQTPVP